MTLSKQAHIPENHPGQITSGASAALAMPEKVRQAVVGNTAEIFTDIYQEESNIVIWQRTLSETLKHSVNEFLLSKPTFQTSMTVAPQNVVEELNKSFGCSENFMELSENIAEIADMFCYLFALKRIGLRLSVLQRAMCPKFHVDRVPCRLISTYQGIATEWLPHELVDRSKLGMGSLGLPDSQSGLFQNKTDIQQLNAGDVALLKGELWEGNEDAGLVHRSPDLPVNESRLILTLDFSD